MKPEIDEQDERIARAITSFLQRESVRRAATGSSPRDLAVAIRLRERRASPFRSAVVVAIAAGVIAGVVAASLLTRQSPASVGSSLSPSPSPALHLPVIGAGQDCPVSRPSTVESHGSIPLLGAEPRSMNGRRDLRSLSSGPPILRSRVVRWFAVSDSTGRVTSASAMHSTQPCPYSCKPEHRRSRASVDVSS